MKQLLNTLFVTSEDIYLSLEGENVLANRDKTVVARYPLHTLQAIVSFSYAGASPALMGKCAEAGIGLAFCSPHGRFLARTCGESSGNVLLRREQYRVADDPARSCEIARTMIFGKLSNGAASIQRTLRDHALRVAGCGLEDAAANIRAMLPQVLAAADLDTLRGIEGAAATAYFSVLDHMLLSRKEAFFFHGRSRRPPLDRVNAMLSFAYSLLAHDCASALESVGLDSYVGFLHRDRPGRQSLALDLMEELRPCMADRFVLTLVNNRMLRPEDFQMQDSGAVLLSDEGRRKFLKTWQERKRDTLTHPYLGEKLSWGMVPYVQALLLARCLRGDLDGYPPFYGSDAMLVLITYDVNTENAAGRKRLRQIAKKCVDYGQRVQNSVFECLLDAGQCRRLQAQLLSIMDPEKDSLRFYYLGKQYEKKVEHFGAKSTYLPEDPLIL